MMSDAPPARLVAVCDLRSRSRDTARASFDVAELRGLPYDVELTDRLRAWVAAGQARRPGA